MKLNITIPVTLNTDESAFAEGDIIWASITVPAGQDAALAKRQVQARVERSLHQFPAVELYPVFDWEKTVFPDRVEYLLVIKARERPCTS